MRDDDLRRLDRLAVLVAHRHLALGVGAEGLLAARVARFGDEAEDFVRVIDRRRHQFRRLAAGVAEHDALIARAFVLVAGGVDALRDVGGLGVQQHFDLGVPPVEAVLLVADLLDRRAGRFLELDRAKVGAAHLAGDDDAIGRRQRLASDADLIGVDARARAFAEEQIDDLVGDAVADLVGMALGNRLAGEQVILSGHRFHLQIVSPLRPIAPPTARQTNSSQPPLLTGGVRLVKLFERISFFL